MTRIRCFDIEVDGKLARVRGDPNMSADSRAAVAEIVRAARKHLESTPAPWICPVCGLGNAGSIIHTRHTTSEP